ncbi:hypothetical protein BGW80DRAFT_777930 [Lactifluus volemus]|nr:hypothetical protein BGW80DRAFT_777930 [Lactifluus volemus]
MSKSQTSSPGKMIRSRMGTLMRRSSSALSFNKPGTSARSSSESLRLDSNAPGQETVMPSPVAESPAREAAESLPEPTGPSKLSDPPITTLDPTPGPPATVAAPKPEQSQASSVPANPLVQSVSEPAPSGDPGDARVHPYQTPHLILFPCRCWDSFRQILLSRL